MNPNLTRREMLAAGAAAMGAGALGGLTSCAITTGKEVTMKSSKNQFRYCLNTSTLQEPWAKKRPLTIEQEVDFAAKAGYDGVELWLNEIDECDKRGGLKDLAKRLRDGGLTVEDGIGFAQWIVDDDAARAKALEQAKRDMDLLAQLGCKHLAAPPAGKTNERDADLAKLAARYRALCDLGDTMGVEPQLELWGFSKTLSRIGEVAYVAAESGHPKAGILLDVYHIYKGGSDFNGLKLLNGGSIHVFHMNDYPDTPARDKIGDQHRVYPGDGIAPLDQFFRDLLAIGFRGALSVELFNRGYWKQEPLEVAKTALAKTKAAVKKSLG